MKDSTLSRRELSRLAVAALGGLVTGALAGCTKQPSEASAKQPSESGKSQSPSPATANSDAKASLLLNDPHVCRGINTCKNKGKKGTTNDCAGQAHCATVPAHDCNGTNDCKGQGGCNDHPGENECKGKGACQVPLSDKTWPKARKRFEELMTNAGEKFGSAPAK